MLRKIGIGLGFLIGSLIWLTGVALFIWIAIQTTRTGPTAPLILLGFLVIVAAFVGAGNWIMGAVLLVGVPELASPDTAPPDTAPATLARQIAGDKTAKRYFVLTSVLTVVVGVLTFWGSIELSC